MKKFRNALFCALMLFAISSSVQANDNAARLTQLISAAELCEATDEHGTVHREDVDETGALLSQEERFMALFVAHFGKETISEKEYLSLQCQNSEHNYYQGRTLLQAYSVRENFFYPPPFSTAGRHILDQLKIRVEQDFCCIANNKTHKIGWYGATTFVGPSRPPSIKQLLSARRFRNACPNLVTYGYEFCGIPGYAIEDDFQDIRAVELK